MMTKSHFRKIFRDISSRRGRTLLATLSIFVGVFGVVTLFTTNDLITSQLHEDIQAEHWPSQILYTVLPGSFPVDNQEILTGLEAIEGVENAEGRVTQPVFWHTQGEETFIDGVLDAPFDSSSDAQITPLTVVDGIYPQAGQNQIAIEQRFSEQYNVHIGDEIVLRVLGGDVPTEENWTVTAIILQTYPNFAVEEPRYKNLFTAFDDALYITGASSMTSIGIQHTDFATAEAESDLTLNYINRQTPLISVFSFVDDPMNNIMFEQTTIYTTLIATLAITAMVVSGFLVVNIINAIIVEQKKQIGVMKSFGATAWSNITMYAGIALGYGIIGLIPGVLLGVVAGNAMAKAIAPLLEVILPSFSISTSSVITGIALGLIVPLVAAAIPVFNGMRVKIIDAMTDLGISSNYGNGPIARLIKISPAPLIAKQALSNVNRKKMRLALTGLTLTLAVAAFMGVMGMVIFLQDKIDEIFNLESSGYNISVQPTEPQEFTTISDIILSVEGVEAVYPEFITTIQAEGYENPIGGNEMQLRGIEPADQLFPIELLEGDGWTNDPNLDGIILSKSDANILDLTIGDTMTYSVGGTSYETTIIGISKSNTLMLRTTLAQVYGYINENNDPLPNAFQVVLTDFDTSSAEADQYIGEIREALLDAGVNATYTNVVQQIEQGSQLILALGGIFGTTAVVIAAIGAIGLLAALSMAVFERQKEIGVMRSIGAKSSTIVSQFLIEGITVSIISWVIAIPMALIFAQLLVNIITSGTLDDFTFPLLSLIIGFIGIIMVAIISSIGPSLSAARKTVSEIIRYQ